MSAAMGEYWHGTGLPAAVQAGGIQDVYMLSHGWNAGVDSARSLYQAMFTLLAAMIPDKLGTSIAVGIIWPSLLFPDDDPATAKPIPSTGQQPQDAAKLQQFHALASGLVTSPALAPEDAGQQATITGDTAAVFGHAASMSKTPVTNARASPTRSPASGTAAGKSCAACPITR
jgi:hypothetical protein